MSLTKPWNKMSKSDKDPKSRILISDDTDQIHRKIKVALTDSLAGISYEPDTRPGISNLLEILFHLLDDPSIESPHALAERFQDTSLKAFKEQVARTVDEKIRDIREAFLALTQGSDQRVLDEAAEIGNVSANNRANRTMGDVRQALGL
jgi:tryptophanyl-tRNA synthetase